jgi:hypothetical protein
MSRVVIARSAATKQSTIHLRKTGLLRFGLSPEPKTIITARTDKKSPSQKGGAGARKPPWRQADAVDVWGCNASAAAQKSLRPFVADFRRQSGATPVFPRFSTGGAHSPGGTPFCARRFDLLTWSINEKVFEDKLPFAAVQRPATMGHSICP